MTPPDPERLPWETAGGPTVGKDVPITGAPRDELAPGVPAASNGNTNGAGHHTNDSGNGERTEEREVRAEDPELSATTNERLTEELRDVVGEDRVTVPADRPHATRGEHPEQHGVAAALSMNWFNVVRMGAIMLTFGGIIALITRDWWLLPLAAGLHALGTMTVVLTTIRMTTISEHPSPAVAAAMAEEGISNPDEHFSRMVEEFRSEPEHGASEVLSPGFNTRDVEASSDPAAAAAQQSSAMTPTAGPSRPSGQGGAPDLIIWLTAFWLFALSVAIPPAMGGGWLWLLTAVMVPLLAAYAALQWLIAKHQEHVRVRARGALVGIVVCTVIAVAGFCAVVALAFAH